MWREWKEWKSYDLLCKMYAPKNHLGVLVIVQSKCLCDIYILLIEHIPTVPRVSISYQLNSEDMLQQNRWQCCSKEKDKSQKILLL